MKKNRAVFSNFWHDESGLVLVLSALTLPVFLLIMALVIDGGRLYVRHSQIQNLAQQSANSGALEISNRLTTQAQLNRDALCVGAPPPSECATDTDVLAFLNASEISTVVSNLTNQDAARLATTSFAKTYDPENGKSFAVEDDNVTVTFSVETDEVRLQVAIETEAPGFFAGIMPGSRLVRAEAISFLDLN